MNPDSRSDHEQRAIEQKVSWWTTTKFLMMYVCFFASIENFITHSFKGRSWLFRWWIPEHHDRPRSVCPPVWVTTFWWKAVVPMLGFIYFKDDKNAVPTVKSSIMKGALSLGMIVGQLVFGVLGDALGRRKIYGKELMITIFGTLMVIVMPTNLSHESVIVWVTMWRLFTGVGIGAGESDKSLPLLDLNWLCT